MAWVYILRGSSGRHYIGSTDNLDRRIAEHLRGSNHTTRRFGATIELLAARELSSMAEARSEERRVGKERRPNCAAFELKTVGRFGRAAPKAFGVGSGLEDWPDHS